MTLQTVEKNYKQTELGLIPEDWQIKTFKDVCWVNQGLQIAIANRLNYPTPTAKKYITIQFLNDGKEIEYIDEYTASVCCKEEDILMTRTGNTGFVVSGVEGVFHNNFFKINYDKKLIDRDYLIFYLKQEKIQKIILTKAGTSTIPDLDHKDFYSIPFVFPPVRQEQRAIVQVLLDSDAVIESLDKLIEKKKNVKLGAMQDLLTGKKRLPGEWKKSKGQKTSELFKIPEDWEVVNLGEISTITRLAGSEYTSIWKEDKNGEIIALRGFNIGQNKIIEKDIVRISNKLSLSLSRSRLCKGDVIYPCVGTIGNAVVINEDNKYHIQQNIARIIPSKEIDSTYLAYNLMGPSGYAEIWRFNATSSQPNVLVGSLRQYRVPLPRNINEQQAIATILSNINSEIEELKRKRDKYRQLKIGMMQQLLTGRIRLKCKS
jgi:type I restriction enzyme S subunit